MTIKDRDFQTITAAQVDADSPATTDLLKAIKENLEFLQLQLNGSYNATQRDHSHDEIGSAPVSGANGARHIAICNVARGTDDHQGASFCSFRPEALLAFPTSESVSHANNEDTAYSGVGDVYKVGARFGATTGLSRGLDLMYGGANFSDGTSFDVGQNLNRMGVIALKSYPGMVVAGTYSGDGSTSREISVGFAPKFVMISEAYVNNSTSRRIRGRSFSQPANECSDYVPTHSRYLTGDCINDFTDTGFTIGSNTNVNDAGVPYHYIALATGNYLGENVQHVVHTTPASGSTTISTVTFVPDVIIAHYAGTASFNGRMWIAHRTMMRDRVASVSVAAGTRFLTGYVTNMTETGCVLGTNMSDSGPGATGEKWDLFFLRGGANSNSFT